MYFKNAELHNIRALASLPDSQGYKLSRVSEDIRTRLNPGAQNNAFNACGSEIRFNLMAGPARVTLQRQPPGDVPVDPVGVAEVWYGPFAGAWDVSPRGVGTEPTTLTISLPQNLAALQALAREQHLPFDPALVRVLLPYDWPTYLIDIQGEIQPPRAEQAPSRRLLCYGSSITHGGSAVRPSESYAMLTAQRLGMDLLNFGFAGSAHMEADLADYLSSAVEWDAATLEMGINVIGSWTVEQFAGRVDAFVRRIAQQHSGKWIFCIDLFTCGMDFEGNPKIKAYRETVKDTVRRLNLPHLVYLDGRSLLTSAAGLTSDLVHPSADGMAEIAGRLAGEISRRVRVDIHP